MFSNVLKHRKTLSNSYTIKRSRSDRNVIFFESDLSSVHFSLKTRTLTFLVFREVLCITESSEDRTAGWFHLPNCLCLLFLSFDWETTCNDCNFFLIKMIGGKNLQTCCWLIPLWFPPTRMNLNYACTWKPSCTFTPVSFVHPLIFFHVSNHCLNAHDKYKIHGKKYTKSLPLKCACRSLRLSSRKKLWIAWDKSEDV